jgi:hypothetical protein
VSAEQIETGDAGSQQSDESKPDKERAGYRKQDECREARKQDKAHRNAEGARPGKLAGRV